MENENIYLDWHKLADPKDKQFATGKQYNVVFERESLSIVFVPGIMGLRLHMGNDLI